MLPLRTSGTTKPIRAATLVQAATLGEGVRDFPFHAFLHVARHERPPLATPRVNARPPKQTVFVCLQLTGGGTLSDSPSQSG